MSESHAVILVDSTSHALRIEKLLARHGIGCKLVPVPRHLSSDCGVCVRIAGAEADRVREYLLQNGAEFQALVLIPS